MGTSSDAITWVSLDMTVARLDNGVPARDALDCAYARSTEICPPSGWRRPPGHPRHVQVIRYCK